MSSQKERPPPVSGKMVSTSKINNSVGSKNPKVITALSKFIPPNTNPTIGKIRQIRDSIPKLSDHADKLEIKLRPYDGPVLGIHETIRSRATSAHNRRKSAGKTSTDLVSKFDDAIKGPETINLSRTISTGLRNEISATDNPRKVKPLLSQTNSFLLGNQDDIEEEMLKLHDMVTSQAEASLGYGFEHKPRAINSSHTRIMKNKNASSDSQRSLRAMNTKIDRKVNQWMRRNPGLDESAANKNVRRSQRPSAAVRHATPLPLEEGDTITGTTYAVNEKLREISDQFHKSLSEATSKAREMIKTPDEDYVQELAKKTQESLAKLSITEGDIDAVFLNAIKREKMNSPRIARIVLSQENNATTALTKSFKPLHTDLETQKKLHNYVARRNDPLSPRPPRKDFELDYENPVEFFKDADLTDPHELRKRRSLIDASEPQIFQRTIEKGHLNKHREIVDPNYRSSLTTRQRSQRDTVSAVSNNKSEVTPRGQTISSASARAQEKGDQQQKPLKVTTTAGTEGKKEIAKKYYPNSKLDLSPQVINNKLERSVQNIEDATRVANALGSLMSKVALTNTEGSYSSYNNNMPMDLSGILTPPAFGSQSLRPLYNPEDKLKGNNIANLAAELRQMADDSQRAYHSEMNKVQQRYTTVDQMKTQNEILKYSPKNNLSLLSGVSFTDQMLLKKLKSMENFPNKNK